MRTFYDPDDGRILAVSTGAVDTYPAWVAGRYDSAKFYCPGGVPTERTKIEYTMSTATGTVGVGWEFAGFPNGSVLTLDGAESDLPTGDFTFTPTTVGSYLMQVNHPAYLRVVRYLDVS